MNFALTLVLWIGALVIAEAPSISAHDLPVAFGKLECRLFNSDSEKARIFVISHEPSALDELLFKRHRADVGPQTKPSALLALVVQNASAYSMIGEQEEHSLYLRLDDSKIIESLQKTNWKQKERTQYEDPYPRAQNISLSDAKGQILDVELRGLPLSIVAKDWTFSDNCKSAIEYEISMGSGEINEGTTDDIALVSVRAKGVFKAIGHFFISQDSLVRHLMEGPHADLSKIETFFKLKTELQAAGVSLWPQEVLKNSALAIAKGLTKYFPEFAANKNEDVAAQYIRLAEELFGTYKASFNADCPGLSATYSVSEATSQMGFSFAYQYLNQFRNIPPYIPHHHFMWIKLATLEDPLMKIRFSPPSTLDPSISIKLLP